MFRRIIIILFPFLGIRIKMHRLRHYRHLLGFPIHLDHPIVQTSVRVPHDVIQNDQLLQLLPESLLQGGRPDKVAWSWCERSRTAVLVVAVALARRRATGAAAVDPPLLLLPVRIIGPEPGEVLVWPWVFSEEEVGVFEPFEEDLETAWFGG